MQLHRLRLRVRLSSVIGTPLSSSLFTSLVSSTVSMNEQNGGDSDCSAHLLRK